MTEHLFDTLETSKTFTTKNEWWRKKLSPVSDLGTSTAGIYLLEFNNANTRTMCEICSKLAVKTPYRLEWRRFCCLYSCLWKDFTLCSGVSVLEFEQVNGGWVVSIKNKAFVAVDRENPLIWKSLQAYFRTKTNLGKSELSFV